MKKKGFIMATVYTKILVVLAFLLVFFIFYLLFMSSKDRYDFAVDSKASDIESAMMLNNLLNSPVFVDGKSILVSDLIQLAYHDCDTYCPILDARLKTLLSLSEYEYNIARDTKCFVDYKIDLYDVDSSGKPLGKFGVHGSMAGYVESSRYYDPKKSEYCTTSKIGLSVNPKKTKHTKKITIEGGDELTLELEIGHRLI